MNSAAIFFDKNQYHFGFQAIHDGIPVTADAESHKFTEEIKKQSGIKHCRPLNN